MTNCDYVNDLLVVRNLVNNSIIADSDAPTVLNTTQFLTFCWTGVLGKGLNYWEYSVDEWPVKTFQLFMCWPRKGDGIFEVSHLACPDF